MHAKRKWLLSTLLLSSLGVQTLAPSASAEPEPAKAPDEQELQNEKAAAEFVEAPTEVVSEETENRTLYSKEYLLSDDSRETVLSPVPLHYRDASGDYQDIKLSLTLESAASAEETPAPTAPPAEESTAPEAAPNPADETQTPDEQSADEASLSSAEGSRTFSELHAAALQAEASPSAESDPTAETEPAPSDEQPAAAPSDEQTPTPDPAPKEGTPADETSDPQTPDPEADKPAAPSTESETNYTSATVPYTPSLHNAYAEGFALGTNGNSIALTPVGAQDSQADVAAADKGVLTYSGVWASTDARLALTPAGIEQTLNLADAGAPSVFSFAVQGELGEDLTGGGLAISPAWLTDASGQRREVSQELRTVDGVRTLELQLDTSGLDYPIALHTGVVLDSPAQQAVVSDTEEPSASSAMRSFARSAEIPQDESRTYLQFDLSALPADTAVREAYLTTDSANAIGNPDTLRVLRAAEPWTEATLASDEPRTALRADGASYGKLRTDENGEQRIDLDPDLVTRWLTEEQPNYGMQIEGGDPSAFEQTPQLHIRHSGDTVNTMSAAGTPMQFRYFYDNQNRLQYILFSSGERINFTYDTSGNLIKRQYVPAS
ncbi:DNRLRE domain-containing protein [Saccharibacillus sp. CPCC 101409]|uniref:DNRLRE domain-containing protein n=1 Tax=Saccharibacillus sp. CPCC 101409 TaxID=3058041 RepID=UPI0026723864|nr:DNRLRE domain-containing protein [Saccharibacillus sp. CPCC 101409]MDO3412744.1 DNRLRE domain-containing protein [Saccharibacillus sp. CPCC 101409]